MNVIKYKYFFIGFSAVLTLAAIAIMLIFGFRQGIDFAGGALWQLRLESEKISAGHLQEWLIKRGIEASVRQGATAKDLMIRMPEVSEPEHQELAKSLKNEFGDFQELSFSSIGPAIGLEIRNRALTAFILVLAGISLYVAFAFRKVSQPVSSWKYGFVTLITLFHDALIPAGFFSLLGYWRGAELDTNFIVAILVVMGFSVHDTIVVFDRIRENLFLAKNKNDLTAIINASIKQTFVRSINTSLTLVLVLLALYFFGAENLRYFTVTILLGTIIGTYSSIFVASPLLTFFHRGSKQ
ncbi:MAG: protein translocase subunit SecF [Candidatus Harrisonbacteria bacterium]|nr:protein translocase subunit SecF [Candidatus Harrisonbacteria bacterium]